MAIPAYHELMLPLLRHAGDGAEHRLPLIAPLVARDAGLTPKDLAEVLASGQNRYRNRLAWAKVYLSRAGALEPVQRGSFRITERGKQLLAASPAGITLDTLKQYPEFNTFLNKTAPEGENKTTGFGEAGDKDDTPEETLEAAYASVRAALGQQVLAAVMAATPSFFENLVLDLMLAMGYGGSRVDAASNIAKSGDGGIDGIISEDRLGLDFIYLQAKRWTNSVGSDEVRNFSGSLDAHGAQKGVFITTSTFTASALKYVRDVKHKKIVLIDGERLAALMMDFNVGVAPAKTFEVKRMDLEYFEEETA
ncbi:restriction endonuclease [Enhydrobacter sp.]|jgi:restriction system protein|uniref:restriction endonuclease n=1 Tax=Enhydrobacter sp. TaxID=1894999 RepID=UPI00261DAF34|nr:restriction endonuclease [Enhydrobacter sp.]WIM10196.1 MAG: Mrr restriction system protein [Enhydrobacter sp.]